MPATSRNSAAEAGGALFFEAGGSLGPHAPSYVVRRADTELYEALLRGELCYVLTPRQMGKSSLKVRTATRLKQEGLRVAVLDLTAIGRNLTVEQWCFGMLDVVGEQLGLEDEVERRWDAGAGLGPVQRFMAAIRQAGLKVIVDPMYGVGHLTLGILLNEARCRVTFIHERRNPLFGGRSPAPDLEALRMLRAYVRDEKYDLGLATDGDADRIAAIDEKGSYVPINDVLLLLYWYLHEVKGMRGGVVRNLATTCSTAWRPPSARSASRRRWASNGSPTAWCAISPCWGVNRAAG